MLDLLFPFFLEIIVVFLFRKADVTVCLIVNVALVKSIADQLNPTISDLRKP